MFLGNNLGGLPVEVCFILDLEALSRRTPVKIGLWVLFPVYVRGDSFQLAPCFHPAVQIIGSQFIIRDFVFQDMIHRFEDGVCYATIALFLPRRAAKGWYRTW